MIESEDLNRAAPANEMQGEDEEETEVLREMLERAEAYVISFDWCPPVAERFLGCGVGGVVAAFLFRFAAKIGGTDDWLWVVVGDLPSAYFVTDEARDGGNALSVYCELMEDWANSVLGGGSLELAFPVAAPATPENAKMLLARTRFIRERVVPRCK